MIGNLPPELELEGDMNISREIEVIVRYNGDIINATEGLGAEVEVLSEDYAIITLPTDKIKQLAGLSQIEYIELPKVLTYMLDSSLRASCIYSEANSGSGLNGRGVLIGIIDSGIDYLHTTFRDAEGNSRIYYIWDQSVEGIPPSGFNEGTEYNNEAINNAIKSGEELGHFDSAGHGTHIAGIAAGNGGSTQKYVGVAPEAGLIVVKLGERGREFFARTTELMRGIKYILDKAVELGMPVAINISYGTNDGSHDGQSLFETYIDEMASYWKNSIVVAMGNEGAQAHHFYGRAENNDTIDVEFNVVGNINTLFLTLWKSFVDEFEFELIAPNGQSSGIMRSGRYKLENTVVYMVIGQPVPYNSEQEVYIRLVGDEGKINNGVWTLRVKGANVVQGDFDVWLPVTEAVGAETAFLKPERDITLTLPASAQSVISVGGYNSDNISYASFSGRGYTRNTNFIKPDLVAPAVNITSSIPGGGYDALSGTSMAAPHVTGAAAILMQWGIVEGNDPFMYGERLKAYLRLGANRKAGEEYPNREWGYGRLCLQNTLNILKREDMSVAIQQQVGLEEAIYSDDYEDFLIEYNRPTIEAFERENVLYCDLRLNNFISAYIKKDNVERIINLPEVIGALSEPSMFGLMQESPLEASGITQLHTRPYLNLRGQGVLVAIIDTGIDYTDPEFLYEDGTTRIRAIWDQSIRGQGNEDVCYGSVYTMEDINAALKSGEKLPTTDDVGHGTTIAKIAGGRSGAAPECELVIVKLKQGKAYLRSRDLLPADVQAFQEIDIMQAVRYVTRVASKVRMPVSICISVGTNNGGHDGNSALEYYLNYIGVANGSSVAVAAGNEGTARHHMSFELLPESKYYDIEISVSENEEGFPVWIWLFNPDIASAGVISPIGETIDRVQAQQRFTTRFNFPLGSGSVVIEYSLPIIRNNDNLITVKLIKPIAGVWRIRIYADNITFGQVHAWMPIKQFTRRGTVFLAPSAATTITVPSTGGGIMTVGGYNSYDNSIYANTGRGPTRTGVLKPTFVAPAVDVFGLTGTSAAAAITAGAAALLLEWGLVRGNSPIMNSGTISAYIIRGVEQRPNEAYPNNVWGFGSLDLNNAFEKIR